MDEKEFTEFFKEFEELFRRVIDADIIAGKFAEKSGLEGHIESTRRVAQEFEKALPEYCKGPFNLIMCYTYKAFIIQPGIARTCIDEVNYYLRRAKEYGALSENKRISGE